MTCKTNHICVISKFILTSDMSAFFHPESRLGLLGKKNISNASLLDLKLRNHKGVIIAVNLSWNMEHTQYSIMTEH